MSPAGKVERVLASAFATFNGLAWSPDGRTMYFADSAPGTIERCDFNPQTGAMAGRKIIATMTNPDGRPDGANCDMAGNYWSAGVSAGRLNCVDRDGKLLQAIALPIPAPSMPCFADRWLFITTLRKNRPEEIVRQYPSLGGLYRMTAPTTGPTLPLFQDS